MNTESSEHAEISLLIPWYANGSLSGPERLAVSRHVNVCNSCRHELQHMQRLQIQWQQAPGAPQLQGDFARLMAAVEEAERDCETQSPQQAVAEPRIKTPPVERSRSWRDALRDWFTSDSGLHGRGLVLASAAGAVLVMTLVHRSPQWSPSSTFHTVATPGSMASLGERDLRIVFAPGIRPEQITDLIGSLNARVVDGPTEIGAFTVRLTGQETSRNDVTTVAGRLRDNPLVLLAEPALPPAPQTSTTPR